MLQGSGFAPFLNEPHILDKYEFGKKRSKNFKTTESFTFRPPFSPEDNWIMFSVSASLFLSRHGLHPLNPVQFASLLLENLKSESKREILSQVDPDKVFAIYQDCFYGLEEAARDFKRFFSTPYNILNQFPTSARYLTLMSSTPRGRLQLAIYTLPPSQIASLRSTHGACFGPTWRIAVKNEDIGVIEALSSLVTGMAEIPYKRAIREQEEDMKREEEERMKREEEERMKRKEEERMKSEQEDLKRGQDEDMKSEQDEDLKTLS